MLFVPTIAGKLSGKIGAIVASHNRGGPYFRLATVPTNPNTPFQQAVRTAVAALTSAWQDSLTQAQRDAWQVYADNVTVVNRIGESVNISGIAHFVRSNVARLQNDLVSILVAPIIFNLGQFAKGDANAAAQAGQTVDIIFGATFPIDPWINEAGSFMLAYVSPPQNSGIKFYKGPYRLAGNVQGDPAPPSSPLVVTAPFAINEGQRVFVRTVVVYADGRATTPIFTNALVAA